MEMQLPRAAKAELESERLADSAAFVYQALAHRNVKQPN